MSAQQAIIDALEPFGDNREKLVELTLSDAEKFTQNINQSVANSNDEEIYLAAHSLKSIMEQIGANEVAKLSQSIETAAKDGDIPTCKSLNADLQEAYIATKKLLKTIV